jgi:O-antigen ligase
MKSSIHESGIKESLFNTLQKISFAPLFLALIILTALVLGVAIGKFNPLYGAAAAGGMAMIIIVLLRQDEIAITMIIAVHLLVDWYLGLHLVALVMALALLFALYFGRSPRHPWVGIRSLWLWILFLLLTIYPAIYGGQYMLYDLVSYYPSDIFGAFLFFWLGCIIAKDTRALRRLLQCLAVLAALLALHTIIESRTGVFLFESSHLDAYLVSVSNYQITGSSAFRAGSFFFDPNWNGTFFATAFFLPFGLFVESRSLLARTLYLGEMLLILVALLFTYSNGAWVAIGGGLFVFLIFIGRTRHRILLLAFISILALVVLSIFSSEIALQLQRASGPNELSLREGAWETAIRVIEAFPLFGVGLGYQAYLIRSEPYRVPAQIVPLSHPHDSYLEWAAMGGIPVLLVFLLLLAAAFWYAIQNWRLSNMQLRPLIGGGIAALAALSVGSISINGWTLPPLAAFAWFLVGMIGSPLIAQNLKQRLARSTTEETQSIADSPQEAQSLLEVRKDTVCR